MRARLDLPEGRLAAVASVQTFGDYLNFHPHLHVLAACGLVDRVGRFHLLPVDNIEPLAELFRHRFIAALNRERFISEKKTRQILAWTQSGFSLDAGEKPVASHDVEGRRRLAEWERSGHRLPSGSPQGERSESINWRRLASMA